MTIFYFRVIHIVVNLIGMKVVASDTVRFGTNQILDSFKEGVVIAENDS